MKLIKILIWILFIYFSYIVALSFWYLSGLLILGTIFWWALISQLAYKNFYKKNIKFYNFILYPIIYITISIGLFFIPENTTGVYEFSNWDKNIVFQWMYHVGTQQYYAQVIDNIEKYRKLDYTIVYEWIKMEKSSTGEVVDDKLENIFSGTDFLKNKYLFFEWDIIWNKYLKDEDLNIDISNLKIQELFKEKQAEEESDKTYSEEKINIQAWVNSWSKINNFIYNYKSKYITALDYKFITIHYNLGLYLSLLNQSTQKSILDSILKDYRDEYLYDNVMKLENDKIFIIYWEWHVDWFYNHLNKNNNWKVLKLQELEPLKR
jgi:hypothetical protein